MCVLCVYYAHSVQVSCVSTRGVRVVVCVGAKEFPKDTRKYINKHDYVSVNQQQVMEHPVIGVLPPHARPLHTCRKRFAHVCFSQPLDARF